MAAPAGASCGPGLRHLRCEAGLTQQSLADRAGVSVAVIRDLEQGRTQRLRAGTGQRLAKVLNVRPELLAVGASTCQHAPELRIAVLGPLAVYRRGVAVPLGGPRQRALLGLLAVQPDVPIHREVIADVLWRGGASPPTSNAIIQSCISRLRGLLEPGRPLRSRTGLLASDASHYWLCIPDGHRESTAQHHCAELDLLAFRRLAAAAQRSDEAGDRSAAVQTYERAMSLWRGEPLADVDLMREHPVLVTLANELMRVLYAYADATAGSGQYDGVLSHLRAHGARYPLDEALQARLMLALAGCGRQAEALKVYEDLRRRLDEELGVLPGSALRDAHAWVLRQQPGNQVRGLSLVPRPDLVTPHQLPPAVGCFAGRERELAELSALLDQADGQGSGTIVISAVGGSAGVGKTALATHWGHRVAGRFPDGQLYADLRGWGPSADPVPPADLISRFLHALGVPADQVPADAAARQNLYRSLLATRRILLVLDNARDTAQVRPLLPGGSSCVVLVTSRSRLAGLIAAEAAYPLSLDVLTPGEARQLLVLRLGRDRVAAEPDAAGELAELCARLPLALAIAASRACLHPAMSLATLADGLRDASARLAALDAGDSISVEAAFSWSYQHLPEPGRRMFRLLSLHPGPDISVAAAASLAAINPGQARAMLRELADASLLTEHLPGRFRCHDLLRTYAAERATAEDSQPSQRAAIQRTLDHYLQSAHVANQMLPQCAARNPLGPLQPGVIPELPGDYRQAMAWFDAEQHVLAALVDRAVSAGFDESGWQLGVRIAGFFVHLGNSGSSAKILKAALAAARQLGDRQAQAQVHCRIGGMFIQLGAYDDAEHHYQQALVLCQEADDRAGQAQANFCLGIAANLQGRHSKALTHTCRALALTEPEDEYRVRASALGNLGWHHACLGEYALALVYCRQAITLHQEDGDRHHEASAWDSLGFAQSHLGRHDEAISSYQLALALYRQVESRANEAASLNHLGDAYQAAGQPLLARQARRRAQAIIDELPDRGALDQDLRRQAGAGVRT